MIPSFAHFTWRLKLGTKKGLEGQTRAQRQGDFMELYDNKHYQNSSWVLCKAETGEKEEEEK
jgi:hypothetical protein